jgi:hypothetical protein
MREMVESDLIEPPTPPRYELPPPGAEIDWRDECEKLVAIMGKGHVMRFGKIVEGAYDAYERAWVLLNRDEDGMIRP